MVSGYVSSFKDPYTAYFPPVEAKTFEENVKGSFGGVGMEVGEREGYINVIAPLKDSPAQKAGIKAGDIIKVESDVHSNSLAHEGGVVKNPPEWAWARGR